MSRKADPDKRRIHKRKLRKQVNKRRIQPVHSQRQSFSSDQLPAKASDRLPWYAERLDKSGASNRVEVHALRRQCKANGRLKMVKCYLVKDKNRRGDWVIRLEGGITGREFLHARKHCGDCFFLLRLHGWTVHKGKLSEDPHDDFFWIPGRAFADALQDFGWL